MAKTDPYEDNDLERATSLVNSDVNRKKSDDDEGLIDLGDGEAAYVEGFGPDEDDTVDPNDDFYANLAETLDEDDLDKLASKYMDLIKRDNDARGAREKRKAEALDKSGIAGPAPGGAEFDGASKVTQPMYAEARIDFSASIMREAFPVTGPFAVKVPAKADRERLIAADRKARFMNWKAQTDPSFLKNAYEKGIYELPDSGTSFFKHYWDMDDASAVTDYVPMENVSIPATVLDFYKTPRLFHKQPLNQYEYEKRQQEGLYRELPDETADDGKKKVIVSEDLDLNEAEEARFEKAGSDVSEYDEDGLRITYEGLVIDDTIEDDKRQDRAAPYVLVIDRATRKVLALYRAYKKDSLRALPRNFVKLDFLPGPDALGYSLFDLIGGIQTSATGIMRALLDAGFMQNSPMLLRLKGAGSGKNIEMKPNQIVDVADTTVDDIRKVFMQVTLGQPSPTLQTLLEYMVEQGKGVISTAEEQVTANSSRMPVGTAMALLEAGAKIYASIHVRVYDALKTTCVSLQRLYYEYMEEDKLQWGPNEEDVVYRDDFKNVEDLVPSSDPQIFSEAQRGMQAQVIMQVATQFPQVIQQVKAIRRYFELLKVPNYDELLPPEQDTALNPVAENVSMAAGKFYPVFPPQDHLAHIQVHLDFLASPVLGAAPFMMTQIFPIFLQHIQLHIIYFYAVVMRDAATKELGTSIEEEQARIGGDWEGAQEIDQMLAKVSTDVINGTIAQTLGKVSGILSKMQQHIQQAQQQQAAGDPAMVQAQAYAQQTAASAQAEQGKLQNAAQELALESQRLQQDAKDAEAERQLKLQIAQQKDQTSVSTNTDDNQTALIIAGQRIGAKEPVGSISNGTTPPDPTTDWGNIGGLPPATGA